MSNLQLQPGKWYRQRDGGKAYVAAELPEDVLADGGLERFVGVDGEGSVTTWGDDGGWISDDGKVCDYDLVAEWVDEPTDAEIAEAVRWLLETDENGSLRCMHPTRLGRRLSSPRAIVDAHRAAQSK